MKVLNDKEIREFLNQHSDHKTNFIKVENENKLKCFTCNKMISVKIAKSRVEMLDEAEDRIEQGFRSLGF